MGHISFSSRYLSTFLHPNRQRTGGWFLLVVGALGLSLDLFQYQEVNIPYLAVLAVGLWLVGRASNVFDEGETKRELRHQYLYGKGAAHLHANAHHRAETIRPLNPALPGMYVVLVGIGATCLSVGLYYLFNHNSTAFFGVLAAIALCMLLAVWERRSVTWLLLAAVVTLLTLVQALTVLSPLDQYMNEAQSIFIFVSTLSVAAFFIVARLKQTYESRSMVRGSLVLFSLAHVGSWVCLADLPLASRWQWGLVSLISFLMLALCVAWIRSRRFSYAKDLGILLLSALLCYVYLFWSDVSIAGLWLLLSIALLMCGFLLPSYSTRLLGLFSLSMAVMSYLVGVVPNPEALAGPIWTHARVWLGVSLMTFLLVSWWWYGFLPLVGKERKILSAIRQGLMAALLGCGVALILTEVSGVTLGLVAVALGVTFLIGARAYRNNASGAAGCVLLLYGLLNLILAFPDASDSLRLLIFLGLAILLLPSSILVMRRLT